MKTNKKSLNVGHSNNNNKFRKMKTKVKNRKSLTKLKNLLKANRHKVLKKPVEVVTRIEDIYTPESYYDMAFQASAFYEAICRLPLEKDDYEIDEVFRHYKVRLTFRYKTACIKEDEYYGMAVPIIDKNGAVQNIVEIINHPSTGAIIRRNEVVFVNDNPKSDNFYLSIWHDNVYYSSKDHIKGYTPHTYPYLIGEHLLNSSDNPDKHKSITIVPSIFLAILLSCIDDDNIYLGWAPYSIDGGFSYEEEYYPTHHNELFSDKMNSIFQGRDVNFLTCIDIKGRAYEYVYDKIKMGTPIEDVLRMVSEQTVKLRY